MSDKKKLRQTIENWREMGLSLWCQFARTSRADGKDEYSSGFLSALEDLEDALHRAGLLDDKGFPLWENIISPSPEAEAVEKVVEAAKNIKPCGGCEDQPEADQCPTSVLGRALADLAAIRASKPGRGAMPKTGTKTQDCPHMMADDDRCDECVWDNSQAHRERKE